MPHKDPEESKAYHRAYYLKNRERLNAQTRANYVQNREQYIAYAKRRLVENRDAIMAARNSARAARIASGKCGGRMSCNVLPITGITVCETHWFESISRLHGLGGKAGIQLLREIWESQAGVCPLTGLPLVMGDGASLDHIIPRSKGGTNDRSNLRFVVLFANRMKTDVSDDELLRRCQLIVQTLTQRQRQGQDL